MIFYVFKLFYISRFSSVLRNKNFIGAAMKLQNITLIHFAECKYGQRNGNSKVDSFGVYLDNKLRLKSDQMCVYLRFPKMKFELDKIRYLLWLKQKTNRSFEQSLNKHAWVASEFQFSCSHYCHYHIYWECIWVFMVNI